MIDKNHIPGHQQALIKDNICVAVLVFESHDISSFNETFNNFEYDEVVDCCELQIQAFLNSCWNGTFFDVKPAESWILSDDLTWESPIPRPGDNYWWNEEDQIWIEVIYPEGAI
jgi:hypothetical protein